MAKRFAGTFRRTQTLKVGGVYDDSSNKKPNSRRLVIFQIKFIFSPKYVIVKVLEMPYGMYFCFWVLNFVPNQGAPVYIVQNAIDDHQWCVVLDTFPKYRV